MKRPIPQIDAKHTHAITHNGCLYVLVEGNAELKLEEIAEHVSTEFLVLTVDQNSRRCEFLLLNTEAVTRAYVKMQHIVSYAIYRRLL